MFSCLYSEKFERRGESLGAAGETPANEGKICVLTKQTAMSIWFGRKTTE